MELDPLSSPLPTTITPAIADALLRYQQGPAANALMRAAVQPAVDIGTGLASLGTIDQTSTLGPALQSALGLVGPVGVGKGAGIAMAALGGAKKAAPKLAELAANEFRSALPKSLPAEHSDTIVNAIKDALGGDWDAAAQMPKAGSAWEKVPSLEDQAASIGLKVTMQHLAPEFAAVNPWSKNYTTAQLAKHISDWPTTSIGNVLGYGGSAKYLNNDAMVLPDIVANEVKGHLDPTLVNKSQIAAENYAKGGSFYNKGAAKPSLADEDIDKALAANPGMSLFDLAGVKNPSAPPAHIPIDTEALPRGATWQMPQAAKEQGYNVAVHHGTRTPTIFDQFALPGDGEIGVHFGSPRAAQEIQGSTLDWSTAPRVYPAAIVAQNPIRMPDLGTWYPENVAKGLEMAGLPRDEIDEARYAGMATASMKDIYGISSLKTQANNLRNYMQSKGYDSIVYKNRVEDKGHDSYILFRESPTSPGHVYGARLPWADFDPSKFTSANIKAGIPLAGATAAYAASHDGSLRPVQDVEHNPFPDEVSQ
jgi:hypothetical protein